MEKIICSAVHVKDNKVHEHQPVNINEGYVIYGPKHFNCLYIKGLIGDKSSYSQGFITNYNRFVNRRLAFLIADYAGQIIYNKERTYNQKVLYSEDLF